MIDLYSASNILVDEFKVKYDPESGIHAMFITFEEVLFCIYDNGSLCVYVDLPVQHKIEVFNRLWEEKLAFFLVKV